jgi:glucokinase
MGMKKQNDAPVISIDIGGTKILTALFSPGGKVTAKETYPTLVQEGPDAVTDRLKTAIDNMLKTNNIRPSQLGGIGIACAGGINTGTGTVVTPSPNMPGWEDIPLAEIIKQKFRAPVYVVNDASAAALGEHCYGAGRGVDNIVMFTLGTGIGGGIITDGVLYLGAVGAAGELGHMTVDDSGLECGCGNKGCLEMYASGTAVARNAKQRLEQGEESVLTGMVDGNLDNITAEIVATAARKSDKLAWEVIEQASYYLGVGMVNIVNIFNPEMIIIGGGMAEMGEMLINQGIQMVKTRAFRVASQAVSINLARLGNEAGIYGAAAFVLNEI